MKIVMPSDAVVLFRVSSSFNNMHFANFVWAFHLLHFIFSCMNFQMPIIRPIHDGTHQSYNVNARKYVLDFQAFKKVSFLLQYKFL